MAFQLDHNNGLAVRRLADILMTQGNTASAARYYEQLLGVEGLGDDPGILNNLANIHAADDLDKALAIALRGLESEGGHSAGWTQYHGRGGR